MPRSKALSFVLLSALLASVSANPGFAKPVLSGALDVCAVDGGIIVHSLGKVSCCATPPGGTRYCVVCLIDAAGKYDCNQNDVVTRAAPPGGTTRN